MIDNKDGLLRPGMTAFARIDSGRQALAAFSAQKSNRRCGLSCDALVFIDEVRSQKSEIRRTETGKSWPPFLLSPLSADFQPAFLNACLLRATTPSCHEISHQPVTSITMARIR